MSAPFRASRRTRRSYRPEFERLETRALPSTVFGPSGVATGGDPIGIIDPVPPPQSSGVVSVSTQKLEVTRGGDPASFTVVLNSQPSADVNITLAQYEPAVLSPLDANTGEPPIPVRVGTTLTITPVHLTFTSANWNTAQTVSVSAPAGAGPKWGEAIWIFGTTTSTDAKFDAQAVPPVSVAVENAVAPNPGAIAVSTDQLEVQQGGPAVTYTVALTSQPTADVTLTITQVSPILDPAGPPVAMATLPPTNPVNFAPLTITPTTLTFTAANWNSPQTISVSAPAQGVPFVLINATAASADPNYDGVTAPSVAVKVEKNPAVGVVLSKDHLDVTRGGAGDSYTVALAGQPAADVTITIAQGKPPFKGGNIPVFFQGDPLQIAPTMLTFTSANWNTPQTVTVGPPTTGSGNQFDFLVQTATSADPNYNDAALPSVSVAVTDPAAALARLVFSKQQLAVTPGGAGDSYTIALASKPTANVTIAIDQGKPAPGPLMPDKAGGGNVPPIGGGDTKLTITPTTLTFTPDNWNTPQTVTVTAPANTDGTAPGHVAWLAHHVTSTDANYNELFSPPIPVAVGSVVIPPPVPGLVGPPIPEPGKGIAVGVVVSTGPATLVSKAGGSANAAAHVKTSAPKSVTAPHTAAVTTTSTASHQSKKPAPSAHHAVTSHHTHHKGTIHHPLHSKPKAAKKPHH